MYLKLPDGCTRKKACGLTGQHVGDCCRDINSMTIEEEDEVVEEELLLQGLALPAADDDADDAAVLV